MLNTKKSVTAKNAKSVRKSIVLTQVQVVKLPSNSDLIYNFAPRQLYGLRIVQIIKNIKIWLVIKNLG
jgi:hypothetical protein